MVEHDALVEKSLGYLVAERGSGGVSVAADDLLVDDDGFLKTTERAEHSGLVNQRSCRQLAYRRLDSLA